MNKFDIKDEVWAVSDKHIIQGEVLSIHFSRRLNKYVLYLPSLETVVRGIPETELAGSYKEAKKMYRKRYKNKSVFNQVVNFFF